MNSRYVPNEAVCPVPVELLGRLLRSDGKRMAEDVGALPVGQRAALAGFCFSRAHLRELGFRIAAHCDVAALRAMTGASSDALIEQSRNPTAFDEGPKLPGRKSIALARSAA